MDCQLHKDSHNYDSGMLYFEGTPDPSDNQLQYNQQTDLPRIPPDIYNWLCGQLQSILHGHRMDLPKDKG
jgi:hypothetical protein